MPDFLLPDLGEGLEEAEVIAWRVKPGDRVTVDQVIAEVETAKAVVEVPVPYAGVVAALHAAPGSTVSVGQPLVTVTADEPAGFREPGVVVPAQAPATAKGNASEAALGAAAGGTAAEDAAAGDAESSGEEASGSVLIGYGTTAAPPRTDAAVAGSRPARRRRALPRPAPPGPRRLRQETRTARARQPGAASARTPSGRQRPRSDRSAAPGRGDLAARPQGSQGRRPRPDQPHRHRPRGRGEPPGRPPAIAERATLQQA